MIDSQNEKLNLLLKIITGISTAGKIDELVSSMLLGALEFTGAERGFFFLLTENETFQCFSPKGVMEEMPEISFSSVRKSIEENRPINLIENAEGETIPPTASILVLELKTVMCAPVSFQPENDKLKKFGVLYVDSHLISRPFDRYDLEFFSMLARHAAVVWHHLQISRQLERDYKLIQEKVKSKYDYHRIVGQCDAMKRVYGLLEMLRDKELDVLIYGETGTGKELIAKAIHYSSMRSTSPLKQLNCAALPEGLVEAELFGVEKSVATDVRKRRGVLEQANGSTLFLDEIGDMPLYIQSRLLRFLEERTFRRIGGREEISSDVRVLAATNKDLRKEVQAGRFRDALRYRLDVVSIHLPPLKDRGDDLGLLAEFFLKEIVEKYHLDIKGFTQSAWQAMRDYAWPGNVRELKHRVHSAAFLAKTNLIDTLDLGLGNTPVLFSIPTLQEQMARFEKSIIIKALSKNQWNIVKTARGVGISPTTLRRKIKKFTLKKSDR